MVEDVADLWALDRARLFPGSFHVLGGRLSALDGVRPEDLNIAALIARVAAGGIDEVVLAMNATLEGQTTAHYLAERLEDFPVRITQLAHGLPVGGELDYLDEGTLAQALRARRPVDAATLRSGRAPISPRMAISASSKRPTLVLRQISTPVEAVDDDTARADRRHVRDDVRRARHRPRRDPGRRAQARAGDRPAASPRRRGGKPVREPRVFINPEILDHSGREVPYHEGCLSVPDHYADVDAPRPHPRPLARRARQARTRRISTACWRSASSTRWTISKACCSSTTCRS